MSADLNNLGLGNNNNGSISSSSDFQATENAGDVEATLVIDGQIQDSTSSLANAKGSSSQKQFTDLPNSPTLLAPNENLLGQKPATTATPSSILDQLQAKVNVQTAATIQTTTKLKSDKDSQINAAADEQFSTLLETQDPPLSPGAIAKLKYMYFNGAKSYTGKDAAALQAQLKSLKAKAQSMTASKFGINKEGKTFDFKPDTKTYNAGLAGSYQNYLKQATTNYLASEEGAALTSDEKNQIQEALNANVSTTTSETVTKVVTALKAEAAANLAATSNLTGVNTEAIAAATPPATSQVFTNSIQTLNQIVAQGTALVNAMPETGSTGATKQSYLSLLSQISAAIVSFEQSIYQAQTTTSQSAQQNAIAKLDISLNQIKQNAKKMQQAQAQEAKIARLGVFAKIFMIIVIVIMAIIAAVVATLSLGTAAPAMAMMMASIVDAAAPIISGATGASLAALEATELTVASVVTTAQTIGETIADASSELASAAVRAVEDSGVKQAIKEAALEVINPQSTTMKVLSTSGDLINAGSSVAQGGMTIGQSLLKANLAILQANADAAKTISEELIQTLEKLIKQLEALLSGQSDLINYVSGTATKIIRTQAQISSQVSAA